MTTTPASGPTNAGSRIEILDIVRGFALFGVLAANMSNWPHPKSAWFDRLVHEVVSFLFEGKSWPLFGLLFGLGVAMQMERERPIGPHLRRMAALFGFGVITFLGFAGNMILIEYASLGLLLVPLRRVRASWLLVLAFCLVVVSNAGPIYRPLIPGSEQVRRERAVDDRLRFEGSFAEGTAARAREIPRFFTGHRLVPQLATFAILLVGYWVGRRRLHQGIADNLPFFRRVSRWALPLGVMGTALATFIGRQPDWSVAATIAKDTGVMLAANMQSIGYGAAIVLLARHGRWIGKLRLLAPVGRMALTNFMMQFLVLRILFDRFFLDIKLGKAGCFLITLSLFAVQMLWSHWWLRRYRFGPAEWLWRAITYWKPQPLRQASDSARVKSLELAVTRTPPI